MSLVCWRIKENFLIDRLNGTKLVRMNESESDKIYSIDVCLSLVDSLVHID